MGMFSGDGSGCSARLFKKYGAKIIGGLHIKMPDSISDVKLLKKNIEKNIIIVKNAELKIIENVAKIKKGKKVKNGLSFFNHVAGLFVQRLWFYNKTDKLKNKLKIDYNKCILCKKCLVNCPSGNLTEENNKITTNGNCTCCYRCINNCPKKAITLIGKQVHEQNNIENFFD